MTTEEKKMYDQIKNNILYLSDGTEYIETTINFIITGDEHEIQKLSQFALSQDNKGHTFLALDKITPLSEIYDENKLSVRIKKYWGIIEFWGKPYYAKIETRPEKKKLSDNKYQLDLYIEEVQPMPIFEKLANMFPDLDFQIIVNTNICGTDYRTETYSLKRTFFKSRSVRDSGDEYGNTFHDEEETTATGETYYEHYMNEDPVEERYRERLRNSGIY